MGFLSCLFCEEGMEGDGGLGWVLRGRVCMCGFDWLGQGGEGEVLVGLRWDKEAPL